MKLIPSCYQFAIICYLLPILSCCSPTRPAVHASNSVHATSIPASMPKSRTDPLVRPNAVVLRMLGTHKEYVEQEGDERRGAKFQQLLNCIDSLRANGHKMSETEMLLLLGQPDYGSSDGRGAQYIYLYSENQPRDTSVFILISSDGYVSQLAWNAASVNDLTKYPQYEKWKTYPTH